MYCFNVKAYAETASFRLPETHTFQKTLPLPPLTSIIGLLGAAMGLHYEESMEFYYSNQIKAGITGFSKSRVNDLWKYRKIKSKETVSAVLTRELLFGLNLELFVAAKNENIVREIQQAIIRPCYALTAGCSDDLLKVKSVGSITQVSLVPLCSFSNTILPGDQGGNYESNIDINQVPLMKDLYTPRVYLLPTEFEFTNGDRRVKRREPFTFIDSPVRLIKPIEGLKFGEKSVALL